MNQYRDNKPLRSSLGSTLIRPLLLTLLLAASPAALSLDVQTRIIGGFLSADGDWPWMTAILKRDISDAYAAQFCGGSLIRPTWVLTAAHCVYDDLGNLRSPSSLDVMVGEVDLFSNGERIPVVRIIPYPAYKDGVVYDDLALLQLAKAAPRQPVRLPGLTFLAQYQVPVVPVGASGTAIGWGTTSATIADYPNLLYEVDLPIVDKNTCQQAYAGLTTLVDTQLCAGFPDGGKDACQGDSGGPLVSQSPATGNKTVQVGVTSFGNGCAQPNAYGVYTRVSSYRLWITQNVCLASERPAAPVINLSLSGNLGRLNFAPVAKATGYILYWAPYPDMFPVYQRDIGTATSVSATLPSGTKLWVAVDAYNGNCLSPFSNIEPLLVP